MKVLVVSDTHRSLRNLEVVLEEEGPIDLLIHLGDIERQMADLLELVDCPVHMVAGNNDFWCNLPDEEIFMLGEHRIMITHGHQYCVSMTERYIQEEARSKGADVVMYGHTHIPALTIEEDLVTLNPGSLTYPRQRGHEPSYMIMEIDRDGELFFQHQYLG